MEGIISVENSELRKGSKSILYTFRRCPYAIRARWALFLCGKQVEFREVRLNNKPIELLRASPKGTVPVLIRENGQVIDESLEIMHWAIRTSDDNSNKKLLKGFNDKNIKLLIDQNDNSFKFHLDRYKYPNRYEGIEAEEHRKKAKEILKDWDKRIKYSVNLNLFNDSETIADWSIWPFVRQYRLIDSVRFDKDKELINLRRWLESYLNSKSYSKIMKKLSFWKSPYDGISTHA
ncbi:glutathione S-transferase [Prochlorococcus marinus]|uniref:Glutathione S-transferase omega class n=2 Tax=Prochlorococcaceae TaxID=2881426 RepID=Q7VCF4_PROMA|nr:glutathione S-transferase [Prochlorococcus marinus]AAP99830.1 Glutathione S-transferase omega class [Prochlorococcus marinus subsp. marinus str. CCMP1375]KGG21870.1 Glutathione S-transferase domain protein [Prochlorococcus marinus str. SS2]KGG23699.1 Glutathione S-transferase domain protein [Prochlorococcus marinus str. SS35]KGG32065.1 Glutathione S-transferase domain protein [Prochlorococcus marinus str. SS51]